MMAIGKGETRTWQPFGPGPDKPHPSSSRTELPQDWSGICCVPFCVGQRAQGSYTLHFSPPWCSHHLFLIWSPACRGAGGDPTQSWRPKGLWGLHSILSMLRATDPAVLWQCREPRARASWVKYHPPGLNHCSSYGFSGVIGNLNCQGGECC